MMGRDPRDVEGNHAFFPVMLVIILVIGYCGGGLRV